MTRRVLKKRGGNGKGKKEEEEKEGEGRSTKLGWSYVKNWISALMDIYKEQVSPGQNPTPLRAASQ